MKTMKDAANDYAEEIKDTTNGMFYADSQDAFRAGVQFAQRWILVEEELPEVKEQKYQIIANNNITHMICYIRNRVDVELLRKLCTHWRPIDIK